LARDWLNSASIKPGFGETRVSFGVNCAAAGRAVKPTVNDAMQAPTVARNGRFEDPETVESSRI